MTVRRDWLLAQMGIAQYRLRRPEALHGEVVIRLRPETRLLIVSSEVCQAQDPLICDVLRAMSLTASQVVFLSTEQVALLPQPLSCVLWFLGIQPKQHYVASQIESPALTVLSQQAQAKRQLWQQICNYDHYLFSSAH